MKNIAALKNLGLSDHEAILYTTLLNIGGSTASVVAKEAGIKRTSVYALLKKLAHDGFVAVYFRKNKRFYYAEKPHRISTNLAKKIETFEALIPTLDSLSKKHDQALGLRFIETTEELKAFYRTVLANYKNKSYRVIGSLHGWEDLDPAFFIQYRKDRGRAKIKTRLLLTADSRTDNPTDPKLLRTVRFLPEYPTFKSTIDIYTDQILIVSPTLSSLAVVVAIPAMVDIFSSIFELLWENIGHK